MDTKSARSRMLQAAFFVAASFCSLCGVLIATCLRSTDGHLVYALDDPYIHLAIAKNLAHHGVWGITRYASTSASSSPLWTVLLALGTLILGHAEWLPLVLAALCALGASLAIFATCYRFGCHPWMAAAGTILVTFGGPLWVLPLTGMEHCLHILLTLMLGLKLLDVWTRGQSTSRDRWVLFGLSFALMGCRFESGFLLVLPVLLAVRDRDFRLALCLAGGSGLALVGFVGFSVLHGMPPLPNSILIKGYMPNASLLGFIQGMFRNVWVHYSSPRGNVLALVTGASVVAAFSLGALVPDQKAAPKRAGSKSGAEAPHSKALARWLWTLVLASVLHVALADVGWFYRYEAYLIVAMGAACLASLALLRGPAPRAVGWVTAGCLALALPSRGTKAVGEVPGGIHDIYCQQVQMARFIHRYYDSGTVALNDIGAVSYYSDARVLDLWGLASDEVRALKRRGAYDTRAIGDLVRRYRPEVTIVYPSWFQGRTALPPELTPVGVLTTPPPTTAGSNRVEFYASSPEGRLRLRAALEQFAPLLPSGDHVEILP